MNRHYGHYTSYNAYEHAKALRRRNARRWRQTHKRQSRIEWLRSDAKKFISTYASTKDKKNLLKLINQRLEEGVK